MGALLEYQLDIMMFMCGMCGILTVMTLITRSLPLNTKLILAGMELCAMLLLMFDRFSYLYRGDVSVTGYYMVRISNGMVYAMSLVIPFLVTRCLEDTYLHEAGLPRVPPQLKIADILFAAGMALVVISQFTGLYYTFDENNVYHRARWNVLCYVVPFLIVLLQEWSIIENRKRINRHRVNSLIVCIALPTVSSVLQIFAYGLSLTNMTMAFVVCIFYTFTLRYLSDAAERAARHELEFYKQAREKEAALFEQTTEALANAIDAKDNYTRGHSIRVAAYSRRIAAAAGLSGEQCEQVYFAALLHDIGKIGVRNDIINKIGPLTEEEFVQIRSHSILGSRILSSIKQAPFLSQGARYHHERYDGNGYPDGLKGEDIPEIARIIAVADAYDAMTSVRSYRQPLSNQDVRRELEENAGTQFDPGFAAIMVKLMEEDLHDPEQTK